MASFKALCLAGVACLAVTASAHAADLLPPPPPVELPTYAPPSGIGGGWYLRGDVGVGIADLRTKSSDFAPGYSVPGLEYDQSHLDDSSFIDAGVGYQFNEYFRADLTAEYRASSHYSGTESYSCGNTCQPGFGPQMYDSYTGSVQSIVGLVNGYVDLGTWWSVTPFFGAGVGVAELGMNDVTDVGQTGGFGYAGNHYQTNFAFALMAGLDFAVTQNLKLELSYRYLDMGNVASGAIGATSCGGQCADEVLHHHLASNDIRLGLRYTFAELIPYQPQLPLIRKY